MRRNHFAWNLTLRKIAIWLSKNCQKLNLFFFKLPKICKKMKFFGNLKKKSQVFGNFLTVKWQFFGGSGFNILWWLIYCVYISQSWFYCTDFDLLIDVFTVQNLRLVNWSLLWSPQWQLEESNSRDSGKSCMKRKAWVLRESGVVRETAGVVRETGVLALCMTDRKKRI